MENKNTQDPRSWFEREARFTWHSKYHRYISEWLANATPLQTSFIKSWSRGYMSPAVNPEVDNITI